MTLSFAWKVALRHLRSRRRNAFVSLITVISILGISVGVAALITVIAVMSGFSGYMKDRILGTNSHILVQAEGGLSSHESLLSRISQHSGVVSAAAYIMGQSLFKLDGTVTGVVVRGIDPDQEVKVTDLGRNMVQGSLEGLDRHGIVIGVEMARMNGLGLGDSVTLVSSSEISSPFGMVPLMDRFQVEGVFDTGMYEYDSSLVLINIKTAASFFGMAEKVTGIEVSVKDVYRTGDIARSLQKDLGDEYRVRDWREMNENLFAALKLEKITMFTILVLIIIVAAFNIVGTLILVVMEKGREIAILKAMGATRQSIGEIFMLEGLIIGVTGTLLGLSLGLGLSWLLSNYRFIELPGSVYYITTIPVRVNAIDLVSISVAAVAISFLATIYPARKASVLDPVEILRYE